MANHLPLRANQVSSNRPAEIQPESFLIKGLGKHEAEGVAAIALNDKSFLHELVRISTTDNSTRGMKAAWILAIASQQVKQSLLLHISEINSELPSIANYSIQRELLKVLYHTALPQSESAKLIDTCFALLKDIKSDVAVKYNCIKILMQHAKKYPELKTELRATLQSLMLAHNSVWQQAIMSVLKRL